MKKKKNQNSQTGLEGIFNLKRTTLDEEWIRQPALFHKHAMKLVDAREELERAKADLLLIEAEMDQNIRLKPDNFGIDKVTEGAIKNAILVQPEYRDGAERIIKAKRRVGEEEAMCDALDHRKRALENLVMLEARDYFAVPRVKEDAAREHVHKMEQRSARTAL